MKRAPLYFLFFLFLQFILVACRPASTALTSRWPSDKVSVPSCPIPEEAPGTHQLVAAAQGICFLYPESFNAFQGEDGTITLYVRSMLNDHVPLASIRYTPSEGQTLEALAAQRLADYAWPDTQPESITLGGEAAVMLDNLPGQDTNRRVVAVHEDRVYDLVFHGIGANYGAAGELAEALYDTVIASFQFIGIEPEAPLLAGPECPFAGANFWYTNEPGGYCLLLPAAYSALQLDPEATEMAFYVDTIQDAAHARLFIKVTDANGRSLEEITLEREAEIEKAVPGSDVMWSWASMLDGEPANEFRQVPGQELSRQVVTLHNGRLYTLTFVPDGPAA
ncbi:MAG TPA: hypothetical protein VF177_03315, partial [Anaerolineae bacterium]